MGKYKSIELFAGAGGLAIGLERAGFDHIGLIEFDKDAADTLKKNRPEWNVIWDDIANISCLDLEEYFHIEKGELDLLSGGAPCQAFSYAGKRLGFEDTRGTLFYHYALFLQKLQPKMFLFENVRGLLTHDHGRTYQTILQVFSDAGYSMQKQVLNAWDYDTPQKRERLITIGVRNDLIKDVHFSFPIPHSYKPVLRDVLLNVPPSEGALYSKYKTEIFKLVPPGGYWRDIPEDIAKEYMKSCWDMEGGRTGILRRLSMDEPSLTVLTSPSQKQTDRCHPLEPRPFTVRENARIQGFPDEWEFCGGLGSKYKQVGNAVPVNLAYNVGLQIRYAMEKTGMWGISFISEEDFKKHVAETIKQYDKQLESYTLKKFNSNLIDPIKMVFDRAVYNTDWKTMIANEIYRQRDKSNNNSIGYFHQSIFRYIKGCTVPKAGWDVIYKPENGYDIPDSKTTISTIYVEMKNKHNTMNSASSAKTFTLMQNQLLKDDDCACFLVEAIAKTSQNIIWKASVDGKKLSHKCIRRVSMDEFYSIVTGEPDAFYKICMALPDVIKEVLDGSDSVKVPHDTVYQELQSIAKKTGLSSEDASMVMAFYLLGFSSYKGFNDIQK